MQGDFDELSPSDREAWAKGETSFPDRKMQRVPPYFWRKAGPFDWTGCPEVEVVVGRLSGVPTLRASRFSADNLLELYESGELGDDLNDFSEEYGLKREDVEGALAFAIRHLKTTRAA